MSGTRPADLVATIEAVYGAGLDATRWPEALASISRTVGGIAATLEVFDRRPPTLTEFHSFGLPPANELAYIDEFSALNPRIPTLINGKPGDLVTDYSVMGERAMNGNAFYADFLGPVGYRYFVGGILTVDEREASLFSVQRATTQGHVDNSNMARMATLLPHVRRAFSVSRWLRGAAGKISAFEHALDWLNDGAALLRKDGHVLYANEAFQAIVRRHDGLRIVRGAVELAAPHARARLAAALAAIARLGGGALGDLKHSDFPAPRRSDMPPYIVSLRPLGGTRMSPHQHDAVAILFVRDPLGRNPAAARMLRELFGFTEAEANLAQALQSGTLLEDYARENAVTLNTVYTHLRRIKEKTGCSRIAKLYRKLKELQVPLRPE